MESQFIAQEGIVSKSHPQNKQYNKIIADSLAEIDNAILGLQTERVKFRSTDIKLKAEKAGYADFISFARKHNARYAGFYTFKGKESALNKIMEFCPEITWQHLRPAFFRDYIVHLKAQGLRDITIHSKFKYYQQLVREADGDVFRYATDPFKGIKLSNKSLPKEALTMDELNRLRDLKCIGWMRKAQGLFLLQFNFLGMRIGDLLTLKPDQVRGGKLYNVTNKDKDYFEIDLTDEARKILEELCQHGTPYLLPFITELRDLKKICSQVSVYNTMVNENLKLVAAKAGIEKNVSSHMARRTWAQLIYELSRDVRLAQRGLGHSSSTTTEQSYLQATGFNELNAANKKLAGD